MDTTNNIVAKIIRGIGALEIGAGLLSFFGITVISMGEGILLAALVLIGSFFGGIVLLGFGEIIALLSNIFSKLDTSEKIDSADTLPRL